MEHTSAEAERIAFAVVVVHHILHHMPAEGTVAGHIAAVAVPHIEAVRRTVAVRRRSSLGSTLLGECVIGA